MCIHISGKCERVSDNVPWPRHKIEAIADCLIRKKRLCLSGYVMSAQIISAFIFMIICCIANIAKVPYNICPMNVCTHTVLEYRVLHSLYTNLCKVFHVASEELHMLGTIPSIYFGEENFPLYTLTIT